MNIIVPNSKNIRNCFWFYYYYYYLLIYFIYNRQPNVYVFYQMVGAGE